MKYYTALTGTFHKQNTPMACWAAALAAVTYGNQDTIIARYAHLHYEVSGLPAAQDDAVLHGDYGLTKYDNWRDAVRVPGIVDGSNNKDVRSAMVAMIALPDHWVVSCGGETNDANVLIKVLIYDPLDGTTTAQELAAFEAKHPTIAYK
jgi:hypothetical protein